MQLKVTRLSPMEKTFQKNPSGFSLKPFSIHIPKDSGQKLNGFLVNRSDKHTGHFIRESPPPTKEKIVLHFTAGNLQSDIRQLTHPNHVSVSFIIARDGTIYRLFSSKDWAFHLGRGAKGGNRTQSRKSIGIELSNYGPLTEREGMLETCYSRLKDPRTGKIGPKDLYCSLMDTKEYILLDTPFRKTRYFAEYTHEQYESLVRLLRYLTATYDIPRAFLPLPERYEATDKVTDFHGILSHVNFRSSGKWDIGPAFDWDRVIQQTQAATIPIARSVDFEREFKDDLIDSEEGIISALSVGPENEVSPTTYGEEGPEEPIYSPEMNFFE